MIRKLKRLVPHSVINYGKHLPEAVVANLKYGFPGRKLRVIGVTGTDGKTTTVNMIYRVLKAAGKKASMISTINAVIGGQSYDTGFHVTSPKPADVQRFLRMAVDHGDEFMVLETTSHALDQFRVWGVPFEIGVVTNITHEHLDYHGSFHNYLQAKAKLLKGVKWAVLNMDDQNLSYLKSVAGGKVASYGLSSKADLNPKNFPLKLKLPGDYNIQNALAAASVGILLGVDHQVVKNSLEEIDSLDGRMEKVVNKKAVQIVVDFAHTPNALQQALTTLRKQTTGKLICVFGCASERDTAKRPVMGKVASRLSDITILADEDPRYEDPLKIIEEIAAGGNFAKGTLYKEPNRAKAIKLAVALAKQGDTIGIFGKGHETSMNYQGKELPWSDKEAVLKALKNG